MFTHLAVACRFSSTICLMMFSAFFTISSSVEMYHKCVLSLLASWVSALGIQLILSTIQETIETRSSLTQVSQFENTISFPLTSSLRVMKVCSKSVSGSYSLKMISSGVGYLPSFFWKRRKNSTQLSIDLVVNSRTQFDISAATLSKNVFCWSFSRFSSSSLRISTADLDQSELSKALTFSTWLPCQSLKFDSETGFCSIEGTSTRYIW